MSLKALAYKAWCISYFHKVSSLVQILLPLLPLIIGLSIYSHEPPTSTHSWNQSSIINPPFDKAQILSDSVFNNIVYYPLNNLTEGLITNVQKRIRIEGHCVGVLLESDIESWFINHTDLRSRTDYGIVFKIKENGTSFPPNFMYTIRGMDVPETDLLFPLIQTPGPMEAGSQYIHSKFVGLQAAIDDSFLEMLGVATNLNWTIQEFPYPDHQRSDEASLQSAKAYLAVIFGILYIFCFTTLVSFTINERKCGIAERLRMTGMNDLKLLLNYLVFGLLKCLISTIILSVLLKIPAGSSAVMDGSNILIIWLVLFIFCIQSCSFFLATSGFFLNPNFASVITTMLYFLPYATLGSMDVKNFPIVGQCLSSIFPLMNIFWAFHNIFSFEGSGAGATFSTILKVPLSGYCNIPLIVLLIIAILSSVIYCFIFIYLLNVKPGPYGYAKPWYYIFPQKYFCKVNPSSTLHVVDVDKTTNKLYEIEHENVEVGLRINNLCKTFGNVVSVKDLSLNIYVGQITALLGHNGAGKTTTLSMITGMFKPTSGTIQYRGYNIFSNLNAYRCDLGLCPQDDMVIEDITVWDHLMIFGMLKNLPCKELKESANKALTEVGLLQKKNAIVKTLSGGMKRKLCLAIALLGHPKVLILDEPTSGLDPEARRELWNILLKLRENRVMIITTHFMEEADALGDRIAIMDHGEVKCYGTPMFLKKHYGAGYQVAVCCSKPTKFNDIINFITSKIPHTNILNKNDEQILLNIPYNRSEDFPSLFKTLESTDEYLITHIGITATTMDDVFLRVREEADNKSITGGSQNSNENGLVDTALFKSMRGENQITNFFQRFSALLFKNTLYTLHKWGATICVGVLLPCFLSYWTVAGTSEYIDRQVSIPSLTLDLDAYGSTDVLLAGNHPARNAFKDIIFKQGSKIVDINNQSIIEGLLHAGEVDELDYRLNKIVAGDFHSSVPNVLYSSIAIHSPPIALNLLYNTILKSSPSGSKYTISTISHPLTFTSNFCENDTNFGEVIVILIRWLFLCLSFSSLIGTNSIKPSHSERTSLLKHLQLMTGLSPVTYWLSFFVWDLFLYCFSICLVILIAYCVDHVGFLAVDQGMGVFILIMLLFGVSCCWVAYCFSFLFKNATNSFNLFCALYLILAIATLILFNLITDGSKWIFVTYILRLFPFCPMINALQLFVFKTVIKLKCLRCPNAYIFPSCHAGADKLSYFDSDMNRELYFLAFDSIFYITLLILIEYGIFAKLWFKIRQMFIGDVDISGLEDEADVRKERDRVDAVLHGPTGGRGDSIVIVDGLAKKYNRQITAVYDVSFASNEGECFGLLGVNGAGKTTTFNILSGLTRPTKGTALIKGYDITVNTKKCLSFTGYCPQFSVLGEGLTGRQMLTLFANLRLAQPVHVKQIVNKWISLLGLHEYADRDCNTYSGGNKRKLNTALAFINNPEVILLDEPTSGVDPVTRRNLWTVLKDCQNNNQTIIISSHSMDECEAVCDRLTIMVKGSMRCIGNIQHLKKIYGEGFIILIKMRNHSDDELDTLKESMIQEFNSKCSLKDEHMVLLHYHIEDRSYQLSTLFTIMEKVKGSFPIIEEYSISDSSLEQVFLSFAKKRDEDDKKNV